MDYHVMDARIGDVFEDKKKFDEYVVIYYTPSKVVAVKTGPFIPWHSFVRAHTFTYEQLNEDCYKLKERV